MYLHHFSDHLLCGTSVKFRGFWDVAPCSHVEVDHRYIALIIAAVRTSETSVKFNVTTRHYIPEDSKLFTRHRENLKPQILNWVLNLIGRKLIEALFKNLVLILKKVQCISII
jgi:hypothetical protein